LSGFCELLFVASADLRKGMSKGQQLIRKLTDKVGLAIGIIGALGMILAVCFIDAADSDANLFEDLVLNLIAEIMGTFFLAYILGYTIERREKKRWLPARCLLYTRLLEITDDLLIALVPEDARELKCEIYKSLYADIYVTTTIEPLKEEILPVLPPLIERDIERHESFDDAALVHAEQQLEGTLDHSAFLLDAEPISLLLKLEDSLRKSIKLTAEADWTDKGDRQVFAHLLGEVISGVNEVKIWLGSMLDQHFVDVPSSR
jgi:hypothetical protein